MCSPALRPFLPQLLGIAICLLLLRVALPAQTFSLQRYNAENGLSESYVYCIIQDERGFLYAGTGAGLFQFNGLNFTKHTRKNGLAEDFVTQAYRDRKNRIWFGHFEGGLTRMDGQQFNSVLDSSLLSSSITGIVEDRSGNIWISAQRNGLVRIDSNLKATLYDKEFSDYLLTSLAINEQGRLLVGTDAGVLICRINPKGPEIDRKAANLPLTRVQAITPRPKKGSFWIATEDEGLWEFTPGNSAETDMALQFGPEQGYPYENVACVMEQSDSRVWMGASGNGFLSFDDHSGIERMRRIMPTASSDTLGVEIVKCIYQDRFGQIWMGTYGHGLLCLSQESFSTIHLNYGAPISDITLTMEDKAGNFWFGTPNGLYYAPRYTPDHFDYTYSIGKPIQLKPTRAFTVKEGLPSNEITALYEDKEYNIWIGTKRSGVAILDGSREEIKPVELSDWSLSKSIHAITQDKRGNIWIATTDGAFRHNPASGETNYYSTRNGLAHNNILNILCDKSGKIWFVTHTNRITVLDGKNFRLINVTQSGEVPNINCIVEDKGGTIWLGSDGMGLYRFDGTSFKNFNESDGLLSNYIYHINPDRYDNLWLAHRKGLTRYIPATDKFIPFPNKALFKFEENPLNSSFIDRKGNIWYGSDRGAIRYNWVPSRTSNAAPYTFISGIDVPGYDGELKDGMVMPYDGYRIRFNFLGLTFLDQSAVRYQYKVEGFAEEWSDLSDVPSVTLQGLGDGSYVFMVRACNAMGNCNEVPAKYAFTIRPPFWKTWWFRILMVLIIGGGIYGYVRYRTYRLNYEKEALEKKINERTRELKEEKEKVEIANLELEKLSLVASKTDNAVFILDREGNLEWVNDGFTRLTGYTLEQFYAFLPNRNLLLTSSNPEIRTFLQKAIARNSSVQYESQLPTTSGDFVWVISTLTTVTDEQGHLRNIIIIDSNISERKKAEEAVRRLNTELEGLVAARTEQLRKENEEHIKTAERLKVINKELDTFVYRASHDLKGPLASLLGLINIASGELDGNAIAERYLGLMERAGKRLDNILVDLIEATQVKQGAVELSEIAVEQMLEQIFESLSGRPDFDKVKFDVKIQPGLKVVSDNKLFLSILQNYIDNTIKYRDAAKEQSRTEISVEHQNGHVKIRVKDNGMGVPEDLQGRVFDMFFRGTKHGGGSGLGLYIVQQAAEKLGGSVAMQSKLGEGSEFSALLPVQKLPIVQV